MRTEMTTQILYKKGQKKLAKPKIIDPRKLIGSKVPKKITEETLHRAKVTARKREIEKMKIDNENELVHNKTTIAYKKKEFLKSIKDFEQDLVNKKIDSWYSSHPDYKKKLSFWGKVRNIINQLKP